MGESPDIASKMEASSENYGQITLVDKQLIKVEFISIFQYIQMPNIQRVYPNRTTNKDWVMWGKGGAMYEMDKVNPNSRVRDMAERVRQWFFLRNKMNPGFTEKLYPTNVKDVLSSKAIT